MGEILKVRRKDFVRRKRQQLSERSIAVIDASLKVHKGDPDRGVFESEVEKRQAGFGIISRIRFRCHLSSKDKSFTA